MPSPNRPVGRRKQTSLLHRTPANRLKTPLGNALTKQACWKDGGSGGKKIALEQRNCHPPMRPPSGNNLSCLSAEKREDNSKNFPQIRRSRLPAQAGTPPPVAPGAGRVVQGGRRKRLPAKANGQLPPPQPAPHQVLVFRPGNKQAFFAALRHQPLGNTVNRL